MVLGLGHHGGIGLCHGCFVLKVGILGLKKVEAPPLLHVISKLVFAKYSIMVASTLLFATYKLNWNWDHEDHYAATTQPKISIDIVGST